MGVKTHLSVNLPQSVSISGAEINLTLRAVTTYVLCCNLAPSMSALKMCIFSNIVMKWQDYCCGLGHTVSCVVQQTSRVNNLSSLVWCDDSCRVSSSLVAQTNRKLRIQKIGKIGNFVLQNRRKKGKINSAFVDINSLPVPYEGYNKG